MDQWTLLLVLKSSYGESYEVAMPTDAFMNGQYWIYQKPPSSFDIGGLEACIEKIKTREFRKELLRESCKLLGEKLAQTMQDAEGWHDASRIDPARRVLKGSS